MTGIPVSERVGDNDGADDGVSGGAVALGNAVIDDTGLSVGLILPAGDADGDGDGDAVDEMGISDGVRIGDSDADGDGDAVDVMGISDGVKIGDSDGDDDGDAVDVMGISDGVKIGDSDGADDGVSGGTVALGNAVTDDAGISVGLTLPPGDADGDGNGDGDVVDVKGISDGVRIGDSDGAGDGDVVDVKGISDGVRIGESDGAGSGVESLGEDVGNDDGFSVSLALGINVVGTSLLFGDFDLVGIFTGESFGYDDG